MSTISLLRCAYDKSELSALRPILLKNPLLSRRHLDFGALSARRIPASGLHVANIGVG
jgi:hypothetical protein